MKSIRTVLIQFPEIPLNTRDAHKLRGYFGEAFKKQSPLLHNHLEDGSLRYRYPLVQYKVINLANANASIKTPALIGLEEGAQLLSELFLKIHEIKLGDATYPVYSKNITAKTWDIGVVDDLIDYRFETLWMALNQTNYTLYQQSKGEEKEYKLRKICVSNMLAFFKTFELILSKEERILARINVKEKNTKFKDKSMLAFEGGFTANVMLPDWIGIGKAVSRGFGTIKRV